MLEALALLLGEALALPCGVPLGVELEVFTAALAFALAFPFGAAAFGMNGLAQRMHGGPSTKMLKTIAQVFQRGRCEGWATKCIHNCLAHSM